MKGAEKEKRKFSPLRDYSLHEKRTQNTGVTASGKEEIRGAGTVPENRS